MAIPGVGLFRGAVLKAEIGEAERFESGSKFCCYAGVVPSTSASGGKEYHGPLIKMSSKYLRTAFVEMANVVKRSRYMLGSNYVDYKKNMPEHAATIKLARKLARITLRVLKSREAYYEELEGNKRIVLETYNKRMKYGMGFKKGYRPTGLSLTCAY